MKKEYKLGLGIILGFFVLLIIFYSIGKKDQNDKLEELGITHEQVESIKNEINSYEEKNKSDTLSEEEINFFNDKLEELGITHEQVESIKNEINSYEEKNKSDTLSEEEINFFEENGLKEDVNRGLFYTYDKYQLDSKMIYFKKEKGDWKWSILLGDWDDLVDDKYDNSKSIYNGYVIKQEKTKEIFEKLRGFSK